MKVALQFAVIGGEARPQLAECIFAGQPPTLWYKYVGVQEAQTSLACHNAHV